MNRGDNNSVSIHRSVSIVLICALCMQGPPTSAFESSSLGFYINGINGSIEAYLSHDDHGEITQQALATAGFAQRCIDEVAVANRGVDTRETESIRLPGTDIVVQNPLANYFASHHFDRNDSHLQNTDNFVHAHKLAFRDGLEYVRGERRKVFEAKNSLELRHALEALGKALHAVQDFYAHSNYVTLADKSRIDQLFMSSSFDITFDEELELFLSDSPLNQLKITGFGDIGIHGADPYPHDLTLVPAGVLEQLLSFLKLEFIFTLSYPQIIQQSGMAKDTQPNAGNMAKYGGDGVSPEESLKLYLADHLAAIASAQEATEHIGRWALPLIAALDQTCVDSQTKSSFSWVPKSPQVDQSVGFTDTSTSKVEITSWQWTFGDGATADVQHPTHTYKKSGKYTVTLAVKDAAEVVDTSQQAITVFKSPVGTLAFSSTRGDSSQPRFQIFAGDKVPFSTAPELLAGGGGGNQESRKPTWSAMGEIAYQFGAPGTRGIHVISPQGAESRVTPPPSTGYACTDNRDPSWSPNGTQIVYSCMTNTGPVTSGGSYDLWVLDTFHTLARPLPLVSFADTLELAPAWSPDGNSIAFVMAGPGAKARIAKLDVATKRVHILTKGGTSEVGNSTNFDPTWSPDSAQIAFSSTRDGGRHIFVMSVQCPEFQQGCPPATRLTAGSADSTNPAWSPDGSKLAFVSNHEGGKHLFTIDPSRPEGPGNLRVRITNGDADHDDPAWNPKFTGTLNVTASAISVAAGMGTPSQGMVTVLDNTRKPVPGAEVTVAVPGSTSGELEFYFSPGGAAVNGQLKGVTDANGQFRFSAVEPAPLLETSRLDFSVTASAIINGEAASGSTSGSVYILAFGVVTVPQIGIPNQRMPLGAQPFSRLRKQRFLELASEQSLHAFRGLTIAVPMSIGSGLPHVAPTHAFMQFLGPAMLGYELYHLAEITLHYHLAVNLLALAQDPPDPNFAVVALPTPQPPPLVELPSPLTPNTSRLMNDRLSVNSMIRAHLAVLLTSIDRYNSALAAQDMASAALQRDAILTYQDTLTGLFNRDADVAQGLLASFQQDSLPNVQLTSTDAAAIQDAVRVSGLPGKIMETLQQLNMSANEISVLQNSFASAAPASLATDLYAQLKSQVQSSRNAALALTVGDTPTDPDPTSVPGTFTYVPPAGTVLPAGVQTLTTTFTPTDTANFSTTTATVPIEVVNRHATVTLDVDSLSHVYDGTPKSVAATTNPPGLSVRFTYNSASTPPTVAGTYSVTATIDDPSYEGAASATLIINRATPTLTWPKPTPIVYGTPLGTTQLNAAASVPGTFAYVPGEGSVLAAGDHTLAVEFMPADAANYTNVGGTIELQVDKASPTITWQNPESVYEGVALSDFQLNATADVPGTFSYSPISGTVLPVGSHRLSVNFTPAASANYTTASASVPFSVTYNVCVLFDQTKAVKSGATIPIRLALCDASGRNRSSSSTLVHAIGVTLISTNVSGALSDAGNSNPDNDFRFDSTLGSAGGYIYNLKTTGLASGTYSLAFSVAGDPLPHAVHFQVR